MGLLDNVTGAAYYAGSDFGNYQFTSLDNVIDQFMIAYVGEDKIISKIKKIDVAFFAQRALQELSFDTFKSTKAYEIVVPSTLKIPLPQDYVNYVKLTWSDSSGVEHVLYPAIKTSNPSNIAQTATPEDAPYYTFTSNELVTTTQSDTGTNYESTTSAENQNDYDDDDYSELDGARYGIDPEHAQINGSYYIDYQNGVIHFSSNMSGKTLILKYISDGMSAEDSGDVPGGAALVHKFAEEAMYKYIAYGCLSVLKNVHPTILAMLKKERFAETRKAKLRLSNIKIEELTQVLRGSSKWIKH